MVPAKYIKKTEQLHGWGNLQLVKTVGHKYKTYVVANNCTINHNVYYNNGSWNCAEPASLGHTEPNQTPINMVQPIFLVPPLAIQKLIKPYPNRAEPVPNRKF